MITDDTKIKRAVVTIKIIGVGGGGNSVIERIAEGNELDVELIAINTDAKQLAYMEEAGVKALAIGRELTKGLGTGGVADLGEAAAKGDEAKIKEVFEGRRPRIRHGEHGRRRGHGRGARRRKNCQGHGHTDGRRRDGALFL